MEVPSRLGTAKLLRTCLYIAVSGGRVLSYCHNGRLPVCTALQATQRLAPARRARVASSTPAKTIASSAEAICRMTPQATTALPSQDRSGSARASLCGPASRSWGSRGCGSHLPAGRRPPHLFHSQGSRVPPSPATHLTHFGQRQQPDCTARRLLWHGYLSTPLLSHHHLHTHSATAPFCKVIRRVPGCNARSLTRVYLTIV